ncbi:hypothetical protein DPSP01_014762 [Paraphaeosphaeria sporulosa]
MVREAVLRASQESTSPVLEARAWCIQTMSGYSSGSVAGNVTLRYRLVEVRRTRDARIAFQAVLLPPHAHAVPNGRDSDRPCVGTKGETNLPLLSLHDIERNSGRAERQHSSAVRYLGSQEEVFSNRVCRLSTSAEDAV